MEFANKTTTPFNRRNQAKLKWNESETARAPSTRDPNSYTIKFDKGALMLAAVSCGDTDETIRLIREGADVNYSNIDGLTSLHQACIDENLPMVKLLIDKGAFIDSCDNECWTPLHAAASGSSIEIIRYLLNKGANIAAVNSEGELPVDLAESPEIERYIEKELKNRGIDADQAREKEHQLMLADAMKWKEKGLIDDVKDPQGASSLHVAASKGYIDVLQILLAVGANPNVVDNDGWTPLHAAVYWKNLDISEFLLSYGADINFKNNAGDTPIKLADDQMAQCLQKIITEYRVNQKKSISIKHAECDDKKQNQKIDTTMIKKPNRQINGILRPARQLDTPPSEKKAFINPDARKILDTKQIVKSSLIANIAKPPGFSSSQIYAQNLSRPPNIVRPPISLASNILPLDSKGPSSKVLDKIKSSNNTDSLQTTSLFSNINKVDSEQSSNIKSTVETHENNLASNQNPKNSITGQTPSRLENLLRFRSNFIRPQRPTSLTPQNVNTILKPVDKPSSPAIEPTTKPRVNYTNSPIDFTPKTSLISKRPVTITDNSDTQTKLTAAFSKITILENEVSSLKAERDNLLQTVRELRSQLEKQLIVSNKIVGDENLTKISGKHKPSIAISRPPAT